MWKAFEVFVTGGILIGLLLAAVALAGYVLWWIALLIAGWFPLVGQRHRHNAWDRLNRG